MQSAGLSGCRQPATRQNCDRRGRAQSGRHPQQSAPENRICPSSLAGAVSRLPETAIGLSEPDDLNSRHLDQNLCSLAGFQADGQPSTKQNCDREATEPRRPTIAPRCATSTNLPPLLTQAISRSRNLTSQILPSRSKFVQPHACLLRSLMSCRWNTSISAHLSR